MVQEALFEDEDKYVLPNRDTVVLGGTGQVGLEDLQPFEADRAHIWNSACALMPSLCQVCFPPAAQALSPPADSMGDPAVCEVSWTCWAHMCLQHRDGCREMTGPQHPSTAQAASQEPQSVDLCRKIGAETNLMALWVAGLPETPGSRAELCRSVSHHAGCGVVQ